MEPVATTQVVGGRLLHMCGSKCKSAAVCNLAVQQITLDMVIVSPTEVFKERKKAMNQAIKSNRICAPEKAQS